MVQNWDLIQEKLFFPVSEEPISISGNEITSHKAIVRNDTNDVLSIVSSDYQLFKNEEVLRPLKKILKDNQNVNIKKVWTAQNGASSFIELDFPKQIRELKKGDVVSNRMIIMNSYNRLKKLSVMFGLIRLVCTNGMVSGRKVFSLSSKHTKNANFESPIENISKHFVINDKTINIYQQYIDTIIEEEKREEILDRIIQKIHLPQKYSDSVLLKAKDSIKTYWDLYNIFTEVISHEITKPISQLVYSSALDKAVRKEYQTKN